MPRIPAHVAAIALGNLLVPLNSTMIVVALPTVARDLGVDRASASWLVTAYLIAMASLQPIGGRVGDHFGRRGLMLGALVVFGAASVGAAFSGDIVTLVALRVLQAVSASAIVPNGLALLRITSVPGADGTNGPARTGTYFGISGATTGIGAASGPVLGGLLAAIDWRWIFLINAPLVAAILVLGWRALPRVPSRRSASPDVAGALALGTLLAVAAWTLTEAEAGIGWTGAVLLVAVAGGAVLFVRYESRHPDPALPPALFAIRSFTLANATIGLANLALYGTLIAVPIALANGPDATVRSGLVLTAMSLGTIVLSPLSGALVDRSGARVPTAVGGLLIALGLFIPVVLGRLTDFTTLLVTIPIAGAGVAMTFPATRIAAIDAAPERLAALASGVTSTSRYLGGIVGALLAALAIGRGEDLDALPLLFAVFALAGLAAAATGGALPGRAAELERAT